MELDVGGAQLLIYTNYGSLLAASTDGKYISIVIPFIDWNDFTYQNKVHNREGAQWDKSEQNSIVHNRNNKIFFWSHF